MWEEESDRCLGKRQHRPSPPTCSRMGALSTRQPDSPVASCEICPTATTYFRRRAKRRPHRTTTWVGHGAAGRVEHCSTRLRRQESLARPMASRLGNVSRGRQDRLDVMAVICIPDRIEKRDVWDGDVGRTVNSAKKKQIKKKSISQKTKDFLL